MVTKFRGVSRRNGGRVLKQGAPFNRRLLSLRLIRRVAALARREQTSRLLPPRPKKES